VITQRTVSEDLNFTRSEDGKDNPKFTNVGDLGLGARVDTNNVTV